MKRYPSPISYPYSIYMYDVTRMEQKSPIELFTAPEYVSSSFYIRAQFSPDGQFIASGSRDGRIYLWEVIYEKVIVVLPCFDKISYFIIIGSFSSYSTWGSFG
jgi:WD40 repeat protein